MEITSTLLPAHQARRLAAPGVLRVESGLLWVTIDGDPEDILIASGECRAVDGRGVIAYALGADARFQFRAASASRRSGGWRWAKRWAVRGRGALPIPGSPA